MSAGRYARRRLPRSLATGHMHGCALRRARHGEKMRAASPLFLIRQGEKMRDPVFSFARVFVQLAIKQGAGGAVIHLYVFLSIGIIRNSCWHAEVSTRSRRRMRSLLDAVPVLHVHMEQAKALKS